MKVVDNVRSAPVPQEHIAAVAARHDVLAVRSVEVHALHCSTKMYIADHCVPDRSMIIQGTLLEKKLYQCHSRQPGRMLFSMIV